MIIIFLFDFFKVFFLLMSVIIFVFV